MERVSENTPSGTKLVGDSIGPDGCIDVHQRLLLSWQFVQIMYFLVLYCAYSVSFIFFAHVRMQTLEKRGKSIRERDLKVIFYLFFILGFLISAGFMGFMRGISGCDCDECHKWRNLYEFHEVESMEVSSISLGGIPAVLSSEGATTQAVMHSCSTVTRQDI